MLQGFSIVVSKVLNIQDGKIPRLEYIHNLTELRDIGSGENACSDPGTEWARLIASDKLNEPTSGISDAVMDHMSKRFIIFGSNVFKHPHGHKGVIVSGYIPVVVLDKFHLMTKVFFPRALPREGNLLIGNVECSYCGAIMLGHMKRKCSPPAPHLHNFVTWLELDLAADVIHLSELSLV